MQALQWVASKLGLHRSQTPTVQTGPVLNPALDKPVSVESRSIPAAGGKASAVQVISLKSRSVDRQAPDKGFLRSILEKLGVRSAGHQPVARTSIDALPEQALEFGSVGGRALSEQDRKAFGDLGFTPGMASEFLDRGGNMEVATSLHSLAFKPDEMIWFAQTGHTEAAAKILSDHDVQYDITSKFFSSGGTDEMLNAYARDFAEKKVPLEQSMDDLIRKHYFQGQEGPILNSGKHG